MNVLDWLPYALVSEEVHVPPAFSRWLATGEQEFGGWFLLDESAAVVNKNKLKQLYPSHETLPFARRSDSDSDDVACLVLSDPKHPRGTVLLIHDGAMPGSEVEKVITSLSQWFEQAHERVGYQALIEFRDGEVGTGI